jgi:hypothetical protein
VPQTLTSLGNAALKDKYLGRKSVSRPTRKRETPRRRKMLSAIGGGYRGV